MRISINTSSFSFQFIGMWLMILALIILLFLSQTTGLITLLVGLVIFVQKNKYLIPKKTLQVLAQVEKTLKSLDLKYQNLESGFSTKVITIKTINCKFFTVLYFHFDKMYTVQGKYLAGAIVKYQRYH